jgi:hypothetical protein
MMEKKEYVSVAELRRLAKAEGVKNSTRKDEPTLLNELAVKDIEAVKVDAKAEVPVVEAKVEETKVEEAKVEESELFVTPAEKILELTTKPPKADKPEEPTEEPLENVDVDSIIAGKNKELQDHEAAIAVLRKEILTLTKERKQIRNNSLSQCVKEFQDSYRTSDAIQKAQQRAAMRRSAAKAVRRMGSQTQ